MCGIVGVYAKRGVVDEQGVRDMNSVLVHRGPMDEGYMFKRHVGLGMRRLSIIDVAGGHQPVYNEDRSVAVILNGEIFNYRELGQELLKRGHRFSTASDTEVIAHLYEDVGAACFSHLNGMFGIALWDDRKQTLLVARDRLGVKPFYYYEDNAYFAFASELKALLLCDFVPRRLDRRAIADFLALKYVRAPRSPFEDVRKLLPGHYLAVGPSGVSQAQYWRLADYSQPVAINEADAIERLRWLLQDAVRIRLRSDVPVGAFLSGGIDSSTIALYAAQQSSTPLRTFTVDFGREGFDEVRYARVMAKALNTDHHETVVTVDDALRQLPRLVWHMDEPNADSAIVPSYLVSRFAAAELRVILSGSGGDEVFGGYARYFDGYPLDHLYRRIAQGPRQALGRAVTRVRLPHVTRRVTWNNLPDADRYLMQVMNFAPAERVDLSGAMSNGGVDLKAEFAGYPGHDRVNRRLFVDACTYLPDDILHITDRMSMAVSLEARTPLLDYRLVEFCAGLPGDYKVRQERREWKVILKKAMGPLLPAEILTRVKWGFGPPIQAWMNNGLLPVVRELYRASEAVHHGLLEPAGVREQLARVGTSVPGFQSAQKLWTLLVLEIWCRVYLTRGSGGPPQATLHDLI